jgi:alpha-galactosidase
MAQRYSLWPALALLCVGAVLQGWTMEDRDLPLEYSDDAVMATPSDIHQVQEWCAQVFSGTQPGLTGPRVDLQVRRQDHSVLQFRRSCIDTPIRIGRQSFEHGLGTHANSEIAVRVPEGARTFRASLGIDNNDNTGGVRGSVRFTVEVDGKEAFRSEVLRGGQEPVEATVALMPGAKELVLKVDCTEDGVAHDQADWADARFEMPDGSALWLDQNQIDLLPGGTTAPFGFLYGGKPSAELLPTWERKVTTRHADGATIYEVSWSDPKTGLVVRAEAKCFDRYAAIDWVLSFENTGAADTPILESIRALDTMLRSGYGRTPLQIHQLSGDACGEQSFLPFTSKLEPGKSLHLAPTGGRPSSISAVPFFNLQYNDLGAIVAVGWTGQWAADFERSGTGPTRITAGMEKTHLTLHPGERIRTPRILLMPWRGDREAAQNRFRRLLLFHYVPQQEARPIRLPVALQCFDRYSWTVPEWATEAGQVQAVEAAANLGCDTHWLDAAWFPGGFPKGVGNWSAKPKEFPRGLKPIAEACHAKGLHFVVWFEPERVAEGTQIAREHPQFVHGGAAGGLFKLDDPEARRWLTDLLSQRIEEYGIDVYRNDFNIDPLRFWQAADAPDRQGMTEIRYVEGLYEMWEELLAKHPGLRIDNCASGGRRMDLEMLHRSMPLWRSDTSCSPGHVDWNQAQSCGLGQYVPLHTACTWAPSAYDLRSGETAGAILQLDYRAADFPMEHARELIAEAKANQKYWYGDLYVHTRPSIDPDHWCVFQYHRPDLDAGILYVFRRHESPYPVLELSLKGISAEGRYKLEFVNDELESTVREATGSEILAGLETRVPRGGSLILRYEPIR